VPCWQPQGPHGKMPRILPLILLSQPPISMAETAQTPRAWMCLICGFIYDEAAGLPDEGIAPGTRWEDVPINWTCPECGARKEDFEMVEI
jgi:rubredoxin